MKVTWSTGGRRTLLAFRALAMSFLFLFTWPQASYAKGPAKKTVRNPTLQVSAVDPAEISVSTGDSVMVGLQDYLSGTQADAYREKNRIVITVKGKQYPYLVRTEGHVEILETEVDMARSTIREARAKGYKVQFFGYPHDVIPKWDDVIITPFKRGTGNATFFMQPGPYYTDPQKTSFSLGKCGPVDCIHVTDTSLGYERKQDLYEQRLDGPPLASLRSDLKDLNSTRALTKKNGWAMMIDPSKYGRGILAVDMTETSVDDVFDPNPLLKTIKTSRGSSSAIDQTHRRKTLAQPMGRRTTPAVSSSAGTAK